ncbi:MAG: hypothetical protein KBG47_01445 [Bacteroidia bacterium]|nr:hypothetical protein [Sphingobacteriaceae bacterium]MBP9068140.1 hypothetical protein [Bacteroidia bacterium]
MQSGEDQNCHEGYDELLNLAHELLEKGKSIEFIEKELKTQQHSNDLFLLVIKKVKLELHKKDLKEGRVYILVGCVFMIVGFVLTCIKFYANESINLVMYGFTTFGIMILFYGLFKIFN